MLVKKGDYVLTPDDDLGVVELVLHGGDYGTVYCPLRGSGGTSTWGTSVVRYTRLPPGGDQFKLDRLCKQIVLDHLRAGGLIG